MKSRVILLLVLAALIALAGRYVVVERADVLPDSIAGIAMRWFGAAGADSASDRQAAPTRGLPTARPTPVSGTPAPAKPAATEAPTAAPTVEPAVTAALENGASGDEVKALQARLRELGFMTGSADGHFGPVTQSAVEAVQEYLYNLEHASVQATPEPEATTAPDDTILMDVEDDGETGEVLDATLEEPTFDGAVSDELKALLLEGGFAAYREDLIKGAKGAEVVRVQNRLNTLDYLYGGVDGVYGANTEAAVKAFQKRNKLEQNGSAGRVTQMLLFSADAKRAEKPALPYMLKVNVSKQRVYAYSWSVTDGAYTVLERSMKCSTGLKSTPTPTGTFSAGGPVARWGFFPKWNVWAQYLYRIKGSILFHSVLYSDARESALLGGSVSKLGSRASHGCVRLSVADAKWIYNHCPAGTTVKVV